MPREKIITSIDIGSVKISTSIASVSDNKISVIGVSGPVPSKGINKGNVVDIDSAVESISNSIERAERMAGISVKSAFVTINGSHIETQNSHGVVAVSPNQASEILPSDVARVIEAAQAISLPSTREVIQVIPRDFSVNSQDGIKDPIGMSGVRLEVETNIITGSATAIRNITKCVTQLDVDVEDLVYTGIASSEAVLTDTEKELGTLLVDIGGGTTSIIAFLEGTPVYSAVLPIGGKLITSDLAIGLRAKLEEAERIKIKLSNDHAMERHAGYATALRKDDVVDLSEFNLEVAQVPKSALCGIIDSRLKEIFELINLELTKSNLIGKLPAGVVVTGGASMTIGVEKIASNILKSQVRLGKPTGVTGLIDEIQGPSFSASIGTLLYGAALLRTGNLLSFDEKKSNMKSNISKVFDKLKSILP